MSYFASCRACVLDGACTHQDALKAAISGLGIRSLKHRCAHRVDLFKPGDPVMVETYPTYDRGEDGEDHVPRCWFKGHFVQFAAGKPLVFVAKDTISEDGGWAFEPNSNGFLKVALARVKGRDGERVDVAACNCCASILSLGQPCVRDPHYTTPSSRCLEVSRAALARSAALPQQPSQPQQQEGGDR